MWKRGLYILYTIMLLCPPPVKIYSFESDYYITHCYRITFLVKKVQTFQIHVAWCLKITEKVSFNIVSEASYVYILSGQKLIEKRQKMVILASFGKTKICCQTVLPDRSLFIGQKLMENAKIEKFKCDILRDFQTLCKS